MAAPKLNCSPNLVLILCLIFPFAKAADNITSNELITDGMTLVSSGGVFALGFFSPGQSTKRYVGIWYNKLPQQNQKVVWVANREHPIKDTTGVLTIKAGNLVILHGNTEEDHAIVWSSTNESTAKYSFAKLLDSGNLVLFHEEDHDETPKVVWESFYYPSSTWLPGMKYGMDKRTGLNRIIVSWKSPDDPAPGGMFMELDLKGLPHTKTYVGSVPYWRNGPWSDLCLAQISDLTSLNFTFVNNQDEIYMVYTPYNAFVLHHLFLDEFGVLRKEIWLKRTKQWATVWSLPRDRCDVYAQCGVYGICSFTSTNAGDCTCLPGYKPKFPEDWILSDTNEGCVAKRRLNSGEGDGFLKLENVRIPDTSIGQFSLRMGMKECENECLRNSSCTAYTVASINQVGIGCMAWYGDLLDTKKYPDGGDDIYIRVDAIEIANSRKNSRGWFGGIKKILVILSAVVVSVILPTVSFRYSTRMKKANVKGLNYKEKLRELLVRNDFLSANNLEETAEQPFFDLDVVMAATDNFANLNRLGQGGFGPVYKGRLSNGQDIAIKRLSMDSRQGMEEFKNEVLLIARLQHRNLVRLLGFCIEGEEKMLIYEYMPNKSLDFLIFDQTSRAILLDWTKRFNIIVGIARGVLYLHQDSRFRIIHRDLKASNVLLDADMNPKISDFGLARIFDGNQTGANTKKVVGTYGYMAPEYAMNGLFSIKSDVFSFGVLLLEIISGKKNRGYYHDDPSSNIIGHAWDLWKEGRAHELVDPLMENSYPLDDVLQCIQVGLLCVQGKASDRPIMTTVVTMLGTEIKIAHPKPPAYVMTTQSTSDSINDVTITMVEAR